MDPVKKAISPLAVSLTIKAKNWQTINVLEWKIQECFPFHTTKMWNRVGALQFTIYDKDLPPGRAYIEVLMGVKWNFMLNYQAYSWELKVMKLSIPVQTKQGWTMTGWLKLYACWITPALWKVPWRCKKKKKQKKREWAKILSWNKIFKLKFTLTQHFDDIREAVKSKLNFIFQKSAFRFTTESMNTFHSNLFFNATLFYLQQVTLHHWIR